ncbi:MAG: formylglycine-generating enzyme family protein [Merismopedia sp. SIO2A8]|nr:formylglycine-generating enzyme family protein [Symploca sp. SIO2B6]NET51047.1 formylglycine-generating enzyme family protein [Merismopedia sp. SIO2A8]
MGLGTIGFGLISVGCSSDVSDAPDASLERPNAVAVTQQELQQELQQQCNTDDEFAWVPEGNFGYGSDRAERDYAYRISALAIVRSPKSTQSPEIPLDPEAVIQAEQRLRQRRWFDREPQQQVRSLPGFCIQKNLVTNADYHQFTQTTGHRAPDISETDYQTQGFLVHPYSSVERYRWIDQQYPPGSDHHPVVLVSYNDALAYAEWKGTQDQVQYRLPTAEEWEKAARGTEGIYFPWGNEWMDDATNWAETYQLTTVPNHSAQIQEPGTTAIATFPLSQSRYGINDMAGNVFEYTSTLRRRNNRTRSVMKGCSWDDLPGFCRAAYEHTRPIESRHILFGFRLIKE